MAPKPLELTMPDKREGPCPYAASPLAPTASSGRRTSPRQVQPRQVQANPDKSGSNVIQEEARNRTVGWRRPRPPEKEVLRHRGESYAKRETTAYGHSVHEQRS